MNIDKLRELITENESAKLDFKQEWYSEEKEKSELIKDVIALANGNIHYLGEIGYLIIGIKEKSDSNSENEIVGVQLNKDIMQIKQQLIQKLNNTTIPAFQDLEINGFTIDSKNIIVIEIPFHPYLLILKKDLQGTRYKKDNLIYRAGEGTEFADGNANYATRKAFEDALDRYNQNNDEKKVSITIHGDVKGVVNAESGSRINQTIS